eukprot:scaffold31374_cov17-Prasinocladus_malaysianus.AAC.1
MRHERPSEPQLPVLVPEAFDMTAVFQCVNAYCPQSVSNTYVSISEKRDACLQHPVERIAPWQTVLGRRAVRNEPPPRLLGLLRRARRLVSLKVCEAMTKGSIARVGSLSV